MNATTREPAEGEEIGPFRVVRRLGGGGMGLVVEAVDVGLDRRVALKLISPHLAGDEEFRRRFAAEARALAALDSPHVVRVHAYGEHLGRPYLATQLIPDGDLATLLEQHGPLAVRDALDLVGQVAAGLADAHAAGLVHRDIKPANVLLRRWGAGMTAYLCDFGVASRVGQQLDTHGTVGTPAWTAPELHAGAPAGVATDVYSLGCLLWATVTGRPPYDAASERDLAAAHADLPVPQLAGDSPIARQVNRILRTAMAKDAAARYRTTAEFRDDLRAAATLSDVAGSEPTATFASLRLVPGVLLLLAVVTGGTHAVFSGGGAASGPSSASATGDHARAVASLTRALADEGVLSRAEATCTARRWIAAVGLRTMVEAGYFDARTRYVDRPRSAMTPRIEAAAADAARACAHRWTEAAARWPPV